MTQNHVYQPLRYWYKQYQGHNRTRISDRYCAQGRNSCTRHLRYSTEHTVCLPLAPSHPIPIYSLLYTLYITRSNAFSISIYGKCGQFILRQLQLENRLLSHFILGKQRCDSVSDAVSSTNLIHLMVLFNFTSSLHSLSLHIMKMYLMDGFVNFPDFALSTAMAIVIYHPQSFMLMLLNITFIYYLNFKR